MTPTAPTATAIAEPRLARAVLVVIPTLNEAPHILALLDQLLLDAAWLTPELELRVAVVDGGSDDRTVALARSVAEVDPRVVVLHNPKRIQSAGINLAVQRLGRGMDVLIRCDAHAVYPTGFCAKLLASLDRHRADAVVVPLDSRGTEPLQQAIAWVSNSALGTGGSAHRAGRRSGFVDHGHHAAFRMDVFRAAGGYDETFTHNEDAELDCRQRALGASIFLDADIRVSYSPRSTFRALWRQYVCYGRGRSRTVRRHRGSMRLRQLLVPVHFCLSLSALVLAPWFPVLLLWPLGYLLAVAAAATLLGVQHRRWSAIPYCVLAALVMHSAWAVGFVHGLLRPEPRWEPTMARPLWAAGAVRRTT